MKLVLIKLNVLSANALAGYFSNGISLASLWGFIKALELGVQSRISESISLPRFGVVQGSVEDKTKEHIKQSLDRQAKSDQLKAPPMDGARLFNFNVSLVVQVETDLQNEELLKNLAIVLNTLRVQGGYILNYFEEQSTALQVILDIDPDALFGENELSALTLKDALLGALRRSSSLDAIWLKAEIPRNLERSLEEDIGEALLQNDMILACTGYTEVSLEPSSTSKLNSHFKGHVRLTEPCFKLIKSMPVYQLKTIDTLHDYAKDNAFLRLFFWESSPFGYSVE